MILQNMQAALDVMFAICIIFFTSKKPDQNENTKSKEIVENAILLYLNSNLRSCWGLTFAVLFQKVFSLYFVLRHLQLGVGSGSR